MLTNYFLREPSTVIADDNRDPAISWQHHLDRTGRGGVDIVAAVGTPVYSRTSGTMRRVPNNGSAGNSCRFEHDSNQGWADVFSHLSSYVGSDGQHFGAGEIVAYTGTTGGVAPHLHWHLLDPSGVRQNPWNYFTTQNAPVSFGWNLPDTATQKDIQNSLAARGRYTGAIDGVWGINSVKGIQTTIKNVGYAGVVDGIPGPNTCKFIQVYAQKFGGYSGPVDSVLGANSWLGFAKGLRP